VAVADATLDALEAAGIATVDPESRRRGYAAAVWPGRLELISVAGRDVLLDGAHNPAGAAALAVALGDLRSVMTGGDAPEPAPLTLVVASMADKDVDGVVAALAASPATRGARIVCTTLDIPRALAAETLAARWRALAPGRTVEAVPDAGRAMDRALETARGPVIVAGSLYLVGDVRRRLVDDPRLRDPEETG
jgi:dihydrofolate synthase/folylpolyglutamate synthase